MTNSDEEFTVTLPKDLADNLDITTESCVLEVLKQHSKSEALRGKRLAITVTGEVTDQPSIEAVFNKLIREKDPEIIPGNGGLILRFK